MTQHKDIAVDPTHFTDDQLIKHFPGFTNQYATVNGIRHLKLSRTLRL